MRRLACAFVLACGCFGCGPDDPNAAPHARILPIVPKEEVPEPVRAAAKAARPDLKFGGVFRTPQGNYQFRARDRKGHGVAVEVTPEGHVLQMITY